MGVFFRGDDTPRPIVAAATRNRAKAAPYDARRAITAAAERVKLTDAATATRPYTAWQHDAWTGFERVGEIHYGFTLLANLLSRVRVYAAVVGETNEAPADIAGESGRKRVKAKLADDALGIMNELQQTDFAGMVRAFSLNMSVPGECYLIKLPDSLGGTWCIRSVDEVQVRNTGIILMSLRGSSKENIELPKDTYIARIWRQHPRFSKEPDSSMVGVADSIEELLMLTRLVRGAARSRMNAGMLFIPDGLTAGPGSTTTAEPVLEEPSDPMTALRNAPTTSSGDDFLQQLMDNMTTPIADEASAASVVPMLTTGPGELGNMIRHITFDRKSDEWLIQRIDKALERILHGIDIPKELVTGMAAVKYSNAVVIDENLYKSNIEPLALSFVDAVASVYLLPRLKALGWLDEELKDIAVWYDPSEIVTRPNSADEATQGVDRGLVSDAAWRREHGYAETDAPSEEDTARQLLLKMTALPDQVALLLLKAALPKMLKDLDTEPPEPQVAPGQQPGAGGEVVQFPNQSPPDKAQPPADPQRTAIKQVGVK